MRKSARTLPVNCWEKRGIKGFLMCLGVNLERKRKRICPGNAPKLPNFIFFFIWGGFVGIYIDFVTLQLRKPLSGHQLRMAWWRHSWAWIWLILESFERYRCVVSRTLKHMEIQWSDQRLWPWEVSWCALHGFQYISIILTSISTHE